MKEAQELLNSIFDGQATLTQITEFKKMRLRQESYISTQRLTVLAQLRPTLAKCPNHFLMEMAAEAWCNLDTDKFPKVLSAEISARELEKTEPYASFIVFQRCTNNIAAAQTSFEQHAFAPGFFQIGLTLFRAKRFEESRKYFELAEQHLMPGAELMLMALKMFIPTEEDNSAILLTISKLEKDHNKIVHLICCLSGDFLQIILPIERLYKKEQYRNDPLFLNIFGRYEAKVLGLADGVTKLERSAAIYPEDAFEVGQCYLNGIAVPQNIALAQHYFQQLLDQGIMLGHLGLGCVFRDTDIEKSFEHLHLAEEHNIAAVNFVLANQYKKLNKMTKAVEYFWKASAIGDMRAQYFLAIHLAFGDAKDRRLKKGIELLRVAAGPRETAYLKYARDHDYVLYHGNAKFKLAQLHHKGFKNYVDKDLVKAERLASEALVLGVTEAKSLLMVLHSSKITKTEESDEQFLNKMNALCAIGDFDSLILMVDTLAMKAHNNPSFLTTFSNLIRSTISALLAMRENQSSNGLVDFKLATLYDMLNQKYIAVQFFALAHRRKYPEAEKVLMQYAMNDQYRPHFTQQLLDELFPPSPKPVVKIINHLARLNRLVAELVPASWIEIENGFRLSVTDQYIIQAFRNWNLIIDEGDDYIIVANSPPGKIYYLRSQLINQAPKPQTATNEYHSPENASQERNSEKVKKQLEQEALEKEERIKREWAFLENRWNKSVKEHKSKPKKNNKQKAIACEDASTDQPSKPAKKVDEEYILVKPAQEIDWTSAEPKLIKILKPKSRETETWQKNAVMQQVQYIDGVIKFKQDYITQSGECRPVGHRALLYYIRRLHLLLDKELHLAFSRRFHSLLIHGYFRINPLALFDFAEKCPALAAEQSIFYRKLNHLIPDNLYEIERSIEDREKDLCIEMSHLKSYCKILEQPNIFDHPMEICAARMSIMIIGEIWNRIRHQFDFTLIDADWLECLKYCSRAVRNTEEHVVDLEAHQDAAQEDGGFEVNVTDDFTIARTALRMVSILERQPNTIKIFFLSLEPSDESKKTARAQDLINCLSHFRLQFDVESLIKESLTFANSDLAKLQTYDKYLHGKLLLLTLQHHQNPTDVKLLKLLDRCLLAMKPEEIQNIGAILQQSNHNPSL